MLTRFFVKHSLWFILVLSLLFSVTSNYEKFLKYLWVIYLAFGLMVLQKLLTWYYQKNYDGLLIQKFKKKEMGVKEEGLIYIVLVLLSSTLEEIAFRLPLLMMYDSYSSSALSMMIISSVIFGAWHWSLSVFTLSELREYMISNNSEDYETSRDELNQKPQIGRRIIKVVSSTIMGFGLGYLCLLKQSMIWPISAHFLWNAIFVYIVGVIVGLVMVVWKFGHLPKNS